MCSWDTVQDDGALTDKQQNCNPMRQVQNIKLQPRIIRRSAGHGKVEGSREQHGNNSDNEEGRVELGGGNTKALLGEAGTAGKEAHAQDEDYMG
jgi:hypothetical protein